MSNGVGISERALRVIQISDTHLRALPGARMRGVDVDTGLAAVLSAIGGRAGPLDLILATGDLVHDEGAAAYERWRLRLATLAVPVYCLPGNHDDPTLMAAWLNHGWVRWERHVVIGGWQFILLDSTVPGVTGGHLAEAELTFLTRVLTAYPNHYAVVCLHHQPMPVGDRWLDEVGLANGDALRAIVERHPQVRAVTWGHVHQAFATRLDGIEWVSAPSTCVQFKAGPDGPENDSLPPGYRWFELARDGTLTTSVEWTIHRTPGRGIGNETLAKRIGPDG